MYKYLLKLYITGYTSKLEMEINKLKQLCKEHVGGQYDLIIIDTMQHPQLEGDEKIVSVDALLPELPVFLQRFLGNLAQTNQALMGMDLQTWR